AFIKVGELINIEIIQPDQEPSTWREHLDAHGEGMHHIAFLMKDMADMDARSALLQANGMPTVQRGLSAKGGYSYVDATEKLNLELLVRNRKPEER
ncbi:MAG TPA: VOC family protein, partial [Clostridia bacterium]|nr:VOC family protein [Clostridia bacterium]